LRNEFKNMRRPLTSAEAVLEAKRKFGAKRPQTRKEETEAIKRRKAEVISFCHMPVKFRLFVRSHAEYFFHNVH